MRLSLLISLSLLLLCFSHSASAQIAPADDFFHGGAQLYISNNIPQAKEVVTQGLKLYPNDEKLKKLEALLNQKNQQQQQQQQNQQQQNQQNQSQPSKSQNQKDQPQKDPQKKSEDQKQQDQQKKDHSGAKKDEQQKPPEQSKPDEPKKDGEKPDQPEAQAQPAKPGEMTPEEAKRLLDAQKGNEQLLQLKPEAKPRDNSRPVKDW